METPRPLARWHPFRLATLLGLVLLAAITLAISADALGRYALSKPIMGTEEIVIWYFLPALKLLPTAMLQREKRHIRVTILTDRLGMKGQKALEIFCHAVSLGIVALFVIYGFQIAYTDFVNRRWLQAPIVLHVYPMSFAFALAMSLLCVQFAIDLVNAIKKPAQLKAVG
ncbi:MAG: TRAP transporter small permease [Chloroflexi bacterium]|nr:TRAP transporter small permease [Chloroflexota bacterium]